MDSKLPVPKPSRQRAATGEIVKVLILAIVSFVAGFALIYFFLRPGAPDVAPDQLPAGESAVAPTENDTPDTPNVAPASTKSAPKVGTVPPGETPNGVSQVGETHYLKCWDKTGIESDGAKCDRLLKLENRFTERLYVVDECKDTVSGDAASGKLVVAAEVNFDTGTVSFWNGAASDIRNASDIGDCLRNRLAGLPIESIDHSFSRYRMYFTVAFGSAAPPPQVAGADNNDANDAPSEPPTGAGRVVEVVKDRVRVRKAPVNGEPFGQISSGNKVRLLKQENDWCHIVTPNNNEGWMICNALQL
ncbi:MAG: SH3 domain-containing protein [Deltaproteobacteria bacterium]|nr:SH3 domain-containing protein [Deltaproteobacteria bacterium]